MKTIAHQIQDVQRRLARMKSNARQRAGLLAELSRLVVRQLRLENKHDRRAA